MQRMETTGNRNSRNVCGGILAFWMALLLAGYPLLGIDWFHLGDLSFRTAMAYHGVLIPAWLLLVLAYNRLNGSLAHWDRLFEIAAVVASLLVGLGGAFTRQPGFTSATVFQVAGLVLAELTVLAIILKAFFFYFGQFGSGLDRTAWWTVTVALLGMSLATPLGHLAGAVKDLGSNAPLFGRYLRFLGIQSKEAVDAAIGAHSHQMLAAFLTAGFALPLVQKSDSKQGLALFFEKVGLLTMLVATLLQVTLYQYSGWFKWEPPDLFSSGPNGIPLDDFILAFLGFGMLFLIPFLLAKGENKAIPEYYSRTVRGLTTIFVAAYLISIVGLGVFIEFHESYFGHGEGSAPGVLNDMAYIRAHLLFGFMIIPILVAVWLNLFSGDKWQKWLASGLTVLVILTGFIGTFALTFYLNSSILKISFAFTIIFLLWSGGKQIINKKGDES